MITVYQHSCGTLWIADDLHPSWLPSFIEYSKIFCYVPDLETFEKIKHTSKIAADYCQIKDISNRFFTRLQQLKNENKDITEHLNQSFHNLEMINTCFDLDLEPIIRKP